MLQQIVEPVSEFHRSGNPRRAWVTQSGYDPAGSFTCSSSEAALETVTSSGNLIQGTDTYALSQSGSLSNGGFSYSLSGGGDYTLIEALVPRADESDTMSMTAVPDVSTIHSNHTFDQTETGTTSMG